LGIGILVGLSFAFDYYRVQEGKPPLFCLKTVNKEGGTIQEYTGMGYKVIRMNRIVGWTRGDIRYYKQNKIGSWFMKIEDFEAEFQEAKKKLEEENEYFVSLEELPQDYDLEKAILDGCFVIAQDGKVYNADEIDEIVSFVRLEQKATLRIVRYTEKGDMVLTDFTYFPEKKVFEIREDHTRDTSLSEEERAFSEMVQKYSSEDYELLDRIEENRQFVLAIYKKDEKKEWKKEQEICRFAVDKIVATIETRHFNGTVVACNNGRMLVEANEGEPVCRLDKQFEIETEKEYPIGTEIKVIYRSMVRNTSPKVLENVDIFVQDKSEKTKEMKNP